MIDHLFNHLHDSNDKGRPTVSYTLRDILEAAPSTEPATFGEFLSALRDRPAKGDTAEWRDLFQTVDAAEEQGCVEVERSGGRMQSIQLTAEGVATLRDIRSER